MKKIITLVLALSALFTSCVYYQDEDYSKVLNKNTYKEFDSLNDPIILTYDFEMLFSQKGEGNGISLIHNGAVYAVYDWETDSIYDYVYAPGRNGKSFIKPFLPALKGSDGKLNFYGYDSEYQNIYVMKSDSTSLEKFDSEDEDSYWISAEFGDASKILEGKGLRYYCNSYDDGKYHLKVKTFAPEKNGFGNVVEKVIYANSGFHSPVTDPEGNYWFALETKNEKTHKSFTSITCFNVQKNAFEEPLKTYDNNEGGTCDAFELWDINISYRPVCADSEYVYVAAEENSSSYFKKLFVIEKATGIQKEFDSSFLKDNYILFMEKINGQVVVILHGDESSELTYLKADPVSAVLTDTGLKFFVPWTSHQVVRGNKIFFVSSEPNVIEMTSLDLDSETVKKINPISLKDFTK